MLCLQIIRDQIIHKDDKTVFFFPGCLGNSRWCGNFDKSHGENNGWMSNECMIICLLGKEQEINVERVIEPIFFVNLSIILESWWLLFGRLRLGPNLLCVCMCVWSTGQWVMVLLCLVTDNCVFRQRALSFTSDRTSCTLRLFILVDLLLTLNFQNLQIKIRMNLHHTRHV